MGTERTVTDAEVDQHLDAVLRASGSALRNYSMASTKDAMRAAMRQAMATAAPAVEGGLPEEIEAIVCPLEDDAAGMLDRLSDDGTALNMQAAAALVRRLATPEQPGSAVQGEVVGWFAYDGDNFEECDSLDDARKLAQESLDECSVEAPDGWPDRTERICYGSILGSVREVGRRAATADDAGFPNYRIYVEYALTDTTPPPAPAAEQKDCLRQCNTDPEGCACKKAQPEARGVEGMVPRSELDALYRAYVRLIESGRDRIMDLGGDCDPVDVMERNDPFLIRARRALAATPNPVRAEQPEGKGAVDDDAITRLIENTAADHGKMNEGGCEDGWYFSAEELHAFARSLLASAPTAPGAAVGVDEVEYEFEVWQDDAMQAGGSTTDYATAKDEADHYALMYGQDGPVEVRMYEKRRIAAALAGKEGA